MNPQRSLRQELITAFTLVFAGALLVAVVGVRLISSATTDPNLALTYVAALIVVDLIIFLMFGRRLIRDRVLRPIDELVGGVEAIAAGDYQERVPTDGPEELSRLAGSVNEMAEKLINHQLDLAENVRSLEETNRELTRARNELVQAEKMASVGRLSAGIAHEVGNPLGAIMGYLGVVRKRAEPDAAELLASAESEARRIDRIIRGLLDYGRPREVTPRSLDVRPVVDEAVDLLRSQGKFEGIDVDTRFADDVPLVRADPFRLQQVLVNLFLNAVHAMASRPDMTLRVTVEEEHIEPDEHRPIRRRDDPPGIDYSHRRRFHERPRVPAEKDFPEDRAVRIVVSDTGSGIARDLIDTIFEPFTTTKEPGEGTGLGLAVAARLIDAMDGTIRVQSTVGEGTTFAILLPEAVGEVDGPEESGPDSRDSREDDVAWTASAEGRTS
ncbi:MAG TPA: ATP-binding protein [Longimicrobiales bacterium]|nr:ATP-binding protein [Longimicrobiales bacterium]